MSKALVIKGANFFTNRVEQIVISQSIPCTGLSLSQNTISFATLGETVQLVTTKTPLDTTDTLVWASSNEDIATVSDGLVTCVGVGSTTITAFCGSQSATCTVSSEITMTLSEFVNGYQFTSTDLTADPPKDYASVYPYINLEDMRGRLYGSYTPTASGIKLFTINPTTYPDLGSMYPIMMPKNVGIIEVDVGVQANASGKLYLCDSTEHQTYVNALSTTNNGALITQYDSVACTNAKYIFTKTADADSFAIQVSNNPISAISDNVTVTFKATI